MFILLGVYLLVINIGVYSSSWCVFFFFMFILLGLYLLVILLLGLYLWLFFLICIIIIHLYSSWCVYIGYSSS